MFPSTKPNSCCQQQDSETYTVCLLPTGSAWESVPGISHLFEHMMIEELHRRGGTEVNGLTTEDYVILFCGGISPGKILTTLQNLPVDAKALEARKKSLAHEIKQEQENGLNGFSRFIWQGTAYEQYERNPLGEVEAIESITPEVMEEFKRRMIKKELFFYTDNGLERVNGIGCGWVDRSEPAEVEWERNRTFNDTTYDIGYVTGNMDVFFLLVQILANWDINKDKRIIFNEKKRAAALIMESGTALPTGEMLPGLRQRALLDMARQVSAVRVNFRDNAINELESVFYCGQSWYRRIQRLFHIPTAELIGQLEKIRKAS